MTIIKPTVGRVLWYYPRSNEPMVRHDDQPCMALLVWPNGDTAVNLLVIDHFGAPWPVQDAELIQEGEAVPTAGGYATWMPYQQGQAKKHAIEGARQATVNVVDTSYADGYRDGYRQAEFDLDSLGLEGFKAQSKVYPDPESVHQRGFNAGFRVAEQMHDCAHKMDLPTQQARQQRAGTRSFPIGGYDFGCALEAAKQGRKIWRSGWNGRQAGLDQFVVRMPELKLPPHSSQEPGAKVNDRTAKWIGKDTPLDCRPYYAMFTQGLWQPGWVPSQSDLEGNDWMIEPADEDLAGAEPAA